MEITTSLPRQDTTRQPQNTGQEEHLSQGPKKHSNYTLQGKLDGRF